DDVLTRGCLARPCSPPQLMCGLDQMRPTMKVGLCEMAAGGVYRERAPGTVLPARQPIPQLTSRNDPERSEQHRNMDAKRVVQLKAVDVARTQAGHLKGIHTRLHRRG